MIQQGIILYLAVGVILMLSVNITDMPLRRQIKRTALVVFGWLLLIIWGSLTSKATSKKGGRRG